MEFHGQIQNGDLILPAPQLVQRERYLRSLKDGTIVKEKIDKATKPKTWKQCKALFGLAFNMIVGIFDDRGWDSSMIYNLDTPTGVPINSDMLLGYFYSLFPTYRGDERITLSKPMTTKETATFYENIGNWAASQWSIVIPDPDPNWKENK
jgi:hypothetical protein